MFLIVAEIAVGMSLYNIMTLLVYDFSEVLKKRPDSVRNFAAGLSLKQITNYFLGIILSNVVISNRKFVDVWPLAVFKCG